MSLNNIRSPKTDYSRKTALIHTLLMPVMGIILGIAAKLFDIYTTNLGGVFSQMSVWIFICIAISVYSSTPKRAGLNVFLFCLGMLAAYYITAELTNSVYAMNFVIGWCIFSLFSPLMGFVAWYAKGRHIISRVLAVCAIILLLLIAQVMFNRIRIADILFALFIAVILFWNKKS